MARSLHEVTVALDWTPNTNHVGFYVAQALGIYSAFGLSVKLISPHSDSYKATPASRVASKEADFGVGPSETLFSYHSSPDRPNLVAVATILQQDLSSIATLKKSDMKRPRELDGKKYASYGARFEGRIVQKMIQNDGGKGNFEELVPEKLGIWSTLLEGKADATWVFSGWEGCAATLAGIELNEFKLCDYGIPYGYSPLIFCHPDTIIESSERLVMFLHATSQGFGWATSQPSKQVTEVFVNQAVKEHPDMPKDTLSTKLVLESLNFVKKSFLGDNGHWGVMNHAVWESFFNWLQDEGLLTTNIQSRNPVPGVSVSLDELREGNGGLSLPFDHIKLENMYTNKFLDVSHKAGIGLNLSVKRLQFI